MNIISLFLPTTHVFHCQFVHSVARWMVGGLPFLHRNTFSLFQRFSNFHFFQCFVSRVKHGIQLSIIRKVGRIHVHYTHGRNIHGNTRIQSQKAWFKCVFHCISISISIIHSFVYCIKFTRNSLFPWRWFDKTNIAGAGVVFFLVVCMVFMMLVMMMMMMVMVPSFILCVMVLWFLLLFFLFLFRMVMVMMTTGTMLFVLFW
mmetsp:Transcript_34217/g.52536  ORF Transcript_34217/g.52536 Transcript_34217/m.52536 type:complete len:202 (+) Transcript_34217:956-1561(+)